MDTHQFRVTYHGPALEASEMDVRELAPALLAMGDLLKAATNVLYPGETSAQVNVRGFRTGSFGIDFSVSTSLLAKLRDFLTSPEVTALANTVAVLTALGFVMHRSKVGLVALLRWLRNRKIDEVQTEGDTAIVRAGGEEMRVPVEVVALLNDTNVRNALRLVLAPLNQPGITSLSFMTNEHGGEVEVIGQDELPLFVAARHVDKLLREETLEMTLSFLTVIFRFDVPWWVCDGQTLLPVKIVDQLFIDSINRNQITFTRGDRFICDVRARQWETAFGTRIDYELVSVKEQISASNGAAWLALDETGHPFSTLHEKAPH